MFTNARIVGSNVRHVDYFSTDCKRGDAAFPMSRSSLCDFFECPAKWIAGVAKEQTDEMLWGSLVDCLALTPDEFSTRFVVTPATYPASSNRGDVKKGDPIEWNWNATYCKEWAEQHGGRHKCISFETADHAQKAKTRLLADPDIAEYIACSQKQVMVTAEWHDAETGIKVPFSGLIDLLPDGSHERFGQTVGDFKTSKSANKRLYKKQVFDYGWHVQGAVYLDLLQACGENRNDFRHVIQENSEPYVTAKRYLTAEMLKLGREFYRTALAFYCQCLATNVWPSYDTENDRGAIDGWSPVDLEPYMESQKAEWITDRIAHVEDY